MTDASPENLRKFLESDALGAERGQGSVWDMEPPMEY